MYSGDWMDKAKLILGFDRCFSVPCHGRSESIMIIWDKNLDLAISSFNFFPGHIDTWIKNSASVWRFTEFYGNPRQDLRLASWKLLARLEESVCYPWIMGGDFNEIMKVDKKEGGSIRDAKLINNFCDVLSSCCLVDLGFKGDNFTRKNGNKKGNLIIERIDKFVIKSHFIEKMWSCQVEHFAYHNSDHRVIVAHIDKGFSSQHKQINRGVRFEEGWTKFEECKKIIDDN